jgi:hypothetical protein
MFKMLKSVCGEECLCRASVFEWHERFKEKLESLQDDELVKAMFIKFLC